MQRLPLLYVASSLVTRSTRLLREWYSIWQPVEQKPQTLLVTVKVQGLPRNLNGLLIRVPVGQAATQLPQNSQLRGLPSTVSMTAASPQLATAMASAPTISWSTLTHFSHRMQRFGSLSISGQS